MTGKPLIFLGMVLLLYLPAGCAEKESKAPKGTDSFPSNATQGSGPSIKDTEAPRVIDTFPPNGAQDVDPTITEISVTFNEEMDNSSWSWAYRDQTKIPEMPGDPYYTDQNKTNSLPVKLEPNKEYVLWINTDKYNYFKDKSGNPSVPYEFRFKTK
jgi:hypothetical protein